MYSFPPAGYPDSGARLTARDLDRFLLAERTGDLPSPQLTRASFTPQMHYRKRDDWKLMIGYGLGFYLDASGTVVYYQKEGSKGGVSGVILHFPR